MQRIPEGIRVCKSKECVFLLTTVLLALLHVPLGEAEHGQGGEHRHRLVREVPGLDMVSSRTIRVLTCTR